MDPALEGRVLTLEREISELRKIVYLGNGHPPLVERVSNLEVSFDSIQKSLSKLNNGVMRIVWLILSSVVGQVLLAVFNKKG
jgi:hypothetical protein